jgi:hypothetical protein
MNINYEIIYSQRCTIGITVERDRKVIIRAPKQARAEVVLAAIESKRFWIWEKLRDPRKYADVATGKEIVPGEAFLFLGQNYTLELVDEPSGEVQFNGRYFELSRADRNSGCELFRIWFLTQAKAHIAPRVAALANAMGIQFTHISVRELKYRWGSCSPSGMLTFNWRIVQAPTLVMDYLIAHELAHILEPNHSAKFWNIVAVHVPAWAQAKDWLRCHGARLEW